jgi:signal transduction histidine kinase
MRTALALLTRHRDAAFALALAAGLAIEVWVASYGEHRVASTGAALLATLPLAVRRRHPIPVFVLVLVGTSLLSSLSPGFDENSGIFFIVFVFNLYSLGANTHGRQGWVATVLVIPCVIWFLFHDGDAFHPGDVAFAAFVIGGPYAAGVGMRLRRQRERQLTQRTVELELQRDAQARAAVAEERRRIARELHDVVAHAISVTVVQARGGRKVLDADVEQARTAFDSIERTGEQALGEMRRLLGMLREDDPNAGRAPQPSLARLDALADDLRSSGLPVEVEVNGETVELAPGVDLAAYRIVQEALTNTLKHAGPAVAHVHVHFGASAVELTIEDDGAGNGKGSGSGNGLVGIRERVAVVGGTLDAGALPDGGFRVHALLPYGDDE